MTTTPPGVCLIIASLDGEGGVQVHSRRLIEFLESAGARVFVCTRNYQRRAALEEHGTVTIRRTAVVAPPDPRAALGHPPLFSLAAISSAWYLIAGAAWCYRHRAEYDVIHCQQMFGALLLGVLLKWLTGKPVMVRVTLTGPLGEATSIRRMPFASIRLRLLRGVDRFVALTPVMARELGTLGIPQSRISVIPNSTPLPADSALDPAARTKARDETRLSGTIVLCVGRLSAEKGIDTLIRAWPIILRRHNDALLVLLGSGGSFGAAKDVLHQLAHTLGAGESVRFQGHVQNVPAYLLAADLFVLPTTGEGMSNAIVEAMAAGCAIVTTDIPAHDDLLRHGETALLVAPGDVDALAAAIDSALNDPALRQRLGRNARAKAVRELSIEAMGGRYIEEYRRLARAR